MIIDYTLWPNTDGNLGNIKVQIPTGIGDDKWPEGDALVANFVYKDGLLSGFVDTKALTVNDSKSTIINYDYFDVELPFTEGEIAITRGERSKYFNVRYSVSNDDNVVITLKYKGCKTVEDVIAVDPDYQTTDIVDGVWSEGLGDLTNGEYMFYYCFNLTSFTPDLSNLTVGEMMFQSCWYLTSFNSDLSSLTNGCMMFEGCTGLTSFSSDLSSLMDGYDMFQRCENLTSFSSDLSSLMDGRNMFFKCKLDTASVQNIADTINTPQTKGTIHIGIGNSTPNEHEEAFNKIASKNWTVYVNVNAGISSSQWNPTSLTPIDGEESTNPIPFWAKFVQSDEKHAQYVDAEGNFYNILGGNFIYGDDLSTYGMFTCEADAAANMRLTKIEKKKKI